jgi:hypothetical protein
VLVVILSCSSVQPPSCPTGLNHLPPRWPLTIVVNEEGGFALEVDGASRLGSKCETGALVLATVIASEFSASVRH